MDRLVGAGAGQPVGLDGQDKKEGRIICTSNEERRIICTGNEEKRIICTGPSPLTWALTAPHGPCRSSTARYPC